MMYAQPLTPSNYSESEEETSYANTNVSPQQQQQQQQSSYMSYPTPSTLNGETSNDTTDTDTSSSYNQFQNVQFTNFSLENIAGLKPSVENKETNFYNTYYQMQYPGQIVGNSNPYEQYQQGLNNELVQPYSVANFDFNYQQKLEPQFTETPQNDSNSPKYEDQSSTNDDQSSEENKQQMTAMLNSCAKATTTTNCKAKVETTSDYLMRPPDSESIAAAAATAKKNRGKRRTRIKFDKEQLDLLEAAFQRTHYPDVNIVDRLSEVLNITTDKISIWFQNRRAKHKRTKKPVGGDKITLFREIENPMELIEAAQREIQLKSLAAEQDNLNSSVDTTRDNKSPVSDHNESTTVQQQQTNIQPIALNTSNQNAADDEDSNDQFIVGANTADQQKFYASDYATTAEPGQHQAYLPHMMYPQQQQQGQQMLPTSFSNHQFFQHPPLLDANQFYQPPVEKPSTHTESEEHQNQQRQEQSRTSLSSESSSNDSRSGSPQSDSSENPEHSEEASISSENHQDYNQDSNSYHLPQPPQRFQEQQQQQQFGENAGYDHYPYLQPGMMRPPYHQQQQVYVSQDNLYQQQQQYVQQQPLPNFSNIFQPYADCTKTEPIEPTNTYMSNLAHMNNAYYSQYYNQ